MPIDVARVLAAEPRTAELAWNHKDVLLYHLGVGAGVPATDPCELRYTLESGLHVLPSFGTVAGGALEAYGGLTVPGVEVELAKVLHGAQRIEVYRPIPVSGRAVQTSQVTAVYDKGKAAVLVLRSCAEDGAGPLWTSDAQVFLRGEGGFGGERGPSAAYEAPERAPDLTVFRTTREDQALLYRLSGDWNPLHADPEFAALAGFDRPILHGLCSYGMVCKSVVDTVLAGDPKKVTSFSARFAGVVFPGETLRVRIWHTEEGHQLTATAANRDDAPVLDEAVLTT